ncbi:radical SAM protein [Streptomyces sp. NPDC021356]|uniref:B12-binding domain-containing radical SAM protein n=1 Tax=Streptomyces sp. NPDC021356 TaxID=3154900 RepID=UPI0034096FFA
MHRATPAEVWLAFPPLVDTNFGSFYPSTAVLAAYLGQAGVPSEQTDLNEEFAVWLLDRARAQGGRLPEVGPETMAGAAARWLSRSPERVFDSGGRHDFGPDSPYGYVVRLLSTPYLVDPDERVLGPLDHDDAVVGAYDAFYAQADLRSRIGEEVSLVGVSVPMGPQLLPALLLAEHVKSLRPDVRVVVGGPAVSLMDAADLDRLLTHHPHIDCVVRFDGEHPLLALAEQTRRGDWQPALVSGASYADGEGVTHHNAPAPGPDINRLPAPLYPRKALDRLAAPALAVTQARGCYWGKCDYCDFIELYDGSPPFRGRHPDGFVDELATLVEEFGVSRFTFITESIPPAFARRVCRALIDRKLRITWNSFAMVDRRFDRELLALMAEAGCEFLVVGMETTITRVLKLVHKSADREENLRFLRDAREVGLPLIVNLIPDLPTTTYDEALRALDDVRDFAGSLLSVSVFPFEATRSSNVGRDPEQFGLTVGPAVQTSGQAQYALNHLQNVDPAMTREQRADVHRRYREFAEEVNSRGYRPARAAAGRPDEAFRLAVEDLDVLESEGAVVCTNMRTREQIRVPSKAVRILRPYLDGAPFTMRQLTERAGERVGGALFSNLTRAGMLTEAAKGAGGHDARP